MKDALLKSLKEAGRVVVLAIIPVAIVSIQDGTINYKTIAIVGVIAFLRWLDSFLHNSDIAAGGLTRF